MNEVKKMEQEVLSNSTAPKKKGSEKGQDSGGTSALERIVGVDDTTSMTTYNTSTLNPRRRRFFS